MAPILSLCCLNSPASSTIMSLVCAVVVVSVPWDQFEVGKGFLTHVNATFEKCVLTTLLFFPSCHVVIGTVPCVCAEIYRGSFLAHISYLSCLPTTMPWQILFMTVHSVRVKTCDVVMWLVRLILHFSCCQTVTLFIKNLYACLRFRKRVYKQDIELSFAFISGFLLERAFIASLPTSYYFSIHFHRQY